MATAETLLADLREEKDFVDAVAAELSAAIQERSVARLTGDTPTPADPPPPTPSCVCLISPFMYLPTYIPTYLGLLLYHPLTHPPTYPFLIPT